MNGIYDWFSKHKSARRWSLIVFSIGLAALLTTLRFSENISDFLPLGNKEREQFAIFQDISGADRIFILFSNPGDEYKTIEAIDSFVESAKENDKDGWCSELSGQFDLGSISRVSEFVYDNIPYFLTEEDYARMDSLLAQPGYVEAKLAQDKQALMFPSSSFVTTGISRDPLGLFSPVLSKLRSSGTDFGFELRDGYIFTPDLSRAVVIFKSPFGNSETENNTKLVKYLESTAGKTILDCPEVQIDIVGGPAIAVENSSRIKKDCFLAVCLSVILIILILSFSFKSVKNILLIFLSVGWGLLFALGGLALFKDSVSIIVIGISSIIFGIAVNYPLHLIAHSAHQRDRKLALKEVQAPLVIGNITTVGAFLALVPLKSTALRDLGLFASLLLVGTILFVLIYLPHYIAPSPQRKKGGKLLEWLSTLAPENSKLTVAAAALITIVLFVFSFRAGFDTNMSHINYMTGGQRESMQYFEDLLTKDESHTAQTVYIYGHGDSFDDALLESGRLDRTLDSLERAGMLARQNNLSSMLVCKGQQAERLARWKQFIVAHKDVLTSELDIQAAKAGFSPRAFYRFKATVDNASSFEARDLEFFSPLTETIFSQNFTEQGRKYVVNAVNVEPQNIQKVKDAFPDNSFDVAGMNASLTSNLSDNFNYIGWACSLIVFFFLWFSFGRLELALISFIPMAISWVWILGLMGLLGIQFNIVNVILATFIFGQGDDYTIFMTEGCQYEYARKKSILVSYKQSIIQSAAIMLVGIGTLIFAKHPALHSLAQITIIGMSSVVLMAYMVPPLFFRWMTTKNGHPRKYPLSLKTIFLGEPGNPVDMVLARFAYKGNDIEAKVRKNLKAGAAEICNKDLGGAAVFEYTDGGYGELAMLLALTHPEIEIQAVIDDEERRQIAAVATEGFINNLKIK